MEIPDYSSGFGWGQTRLWLGYDGKKEDAADHRGPHVSDSRERGARAAATSWAGPCYRDGRAEESGLLGSVAQAKGGRAGRLGSARAGLQATGPQVRFLFLFYKFIFQIHFKMNFEFKSNKTKTTPQNKSNATT
jgi:hypothetical protein